MISREFDLADLDLWSLDNLENENDRIARGDAFVLRGHLRELAPVLAEQILDNHFRLLDFRWIELALDSKPHLAFLNRSSMSDSETECMPSYRMRRMLGRSFTSKMMILPFARPGESSTRSFTSSKNCVFQSAWKSRRSVSSL